ncbi:MAG TPA: hypothetical protein DDX39_12305 [Bacteroidales bacterium]|nr:MAG: hypothetical protein A2W98_11710 [Bacteroidetes bacterium GWF2_33_38]OFY68646.1 MAG: hypothetical protein A2265_02900 [Bacteroidetes bacterium RIFOXYA12_FULL_33_9]OFY88827.1 MAG: hypothetical protein A2236_08430 [Bacteroidetes bacterium RIFOXYA2_FULL_33_7]HBF89415.1 hypothetical protein [Bacteroidales bacterium]
MKDNFEKFVENHHDEFDVREPDVDIWDKIEQSLPDEKKKTIRFTSYFRYAAAAVILLISGFLIRMYIESSEKKMRAETSSEFKINIPEISEAEAYYSSQINEKMDELFKYTSNDPSLKSDIKSDLLELDSIYIELKNDLKDNVANEEVVQAMIQNYRLKLEILEDILSMLEKDKDEKNENSKIEQYDL